MGCKEGATRGWRLRVYRPFIFLWHNPARSRPTGAANGEEVSDVGCA